MMILFLYGFADRWERKSKEEIGKKTSKDKWDPLS